MKKIGWIGLGHMGIPMATNLINAGVPLFVYNRTEEKAKTLVDKGAVYCSSPKEVAEQADIIFTMLTDSSSVEQVFSGEEGVFHASTEGKLIVDMSTISPEDSRRFAALAIKKGASFLDAPVSGSIKPAQEGKLVILVGGNSRDVEICRSYFNILGKTFIHFGDHGSGSFAKLVINSLLAITVQGTSEVLLLAEKGGLDREQVLHMIGESAVGTPLIQGKKELFLKEEFVPAFMLKLMTKDLGLALDAARQSRISLPLTETAKVHYSKANDNGKGDMDLTAIFLELQESNRT
ncbi:NAD(P)-dependent oxidoreductase [Paenibacillus sp. sgz302251]|uniref:NAD(P)-dependent oxidoreductase n=1 Tax=Paenibacillus sp. sgz302251 TaxID=3414493 RepID=UPI003C7D74F3